MTGRIRLFAAILAGASAGTALCAAPAATRQDALPPTAPLPSPAAERDMKAGADAFARGDFATAINAWRQAANAFEKIANDRRRIDALMLLAAGYQSMGHATDAIDTLNSALGPAEARAKRSGNRRHLTAVKNALGSAYTFTEQADRAERYLNEALEGATADNDDAEIVRVQNNLGTLFSARRGKEVQDELPDLENYNKALAAFDASAAGATKTGQPLLAAKALVNKGVAANHNRQYDDAIAFNGESLTVVSALPDSRDKAQLLLTIGRGDQTALDAGAAPADRSAIVRLAYDACQSALRIARSLGDDLTASYAIGFTARLYESAGRYDDALILTRQALFLAQQQQSRDALYRWQWQTGRILAAQHDTNGAIAAYVRAQDTLKDIRNDISLEYGNPNMRSSFREQAGAVYVGLADLLLQRAEARKGTPGEAQDMRAARNSIELLKSAELEDYFQDKCAQLYKEQQQDIDAVARQHRAAIIYIIALPDRTELLVTLPGGLQRFRSPVKADELTRAVREFRELVEKRTTNEFLVQSRQLYNWLIAPAESELKRQKVQTLVFVPDGPLRTIPMAALSDANGKFLIEKYPLAITPGLNMMQPRAVSRQDTVVLRSGLSVSREGFPELHFVPGELTRIGRLYEGTDLLNKMFTGGNVTREMQKTPYTIVHIASHGEFRGDSKRTFLLTFDNRMDLHQLEMLIEPSKFAGRPVELLMLSACQTAKGDDRAALGLAGVAVKAGARSAVATLWSVNDEASSQLVAEFYTQLHDHADISKAEALRRAQMQVIAGKTYAHPAYWSAFLLIGNWL